VALLRLRLDDDVGGVGAAFRLREVDWPGVNDGVASLVDGGGGSGGAVFAWWSLAVAARVFIE